jgi:hypothetical protein
MEVVVRFISILVVWVGVASLCNFGEAAEAVKIIATGEWSKPVADNRSNALRGRLALGEKPARDGLREVVVYVELQDAREFVGESLWIFCEMGRYDFRPDYNRGLKCEMRDKDDRPVAPTGFPFGGAVPKSEWVKLPVDATIRLRATPFGIRRAGAMAVSPDVSSQWIIGDDDANEYFLSGEFAVNPGEDQKPPGDEHIWRGTIVLPAVRIINKKP